MLGCQQCIGGLQSISGLQCFGHHGGMQSIGPLQCIGGMQCIGGHRPTSPLTVGFRVSVMSERGIKVHADCAYSPVCACGLAVFLCVCVSTAPQLGLQASAHCWPWGARVRVCGGTVSQTANIEALDTPIASPLLSLSFTAGAVVTSSHFSVLIHVCTHKAPLPPHSTTLTVCHSEARKTSPKTRSLLLPQAQVSIPTPCKPRSRSQNPEPHNLDS